MRRFNPSGPPADARYHYEVPRRELVERCVARLLGAPGEGGGFFTIRAPRRTGKTWLVQRGIHEIRARCGDRFAIGALSLQRLFGLDEREDMFFRAVPELFREVFGLEPEAPASWSDWLRLFAREGGLFDKPLILFIDELDWAPPHILDRIAASFRAIYLDRERYNLHAIALVGVHGALGALGEPFDVERSFGVGNLTRDEVAAMFAQHRADGGRAIEPEALEALYDATRGHPGLVSWFGDFFIRVQYSREPIALKHLERAYGEVFGDVPNAIVRDMMIRGLSAAYRARILSFCTQPDMPFSRDDEVCDYLFLNGVIGAREVVGERGTPEVVCVFSSPILQIQLYGALAKEPLRDWHFRRPERCDDVFRGAHIDTWALLQRHKERLGGSNEIRIDSWDVRLRRDDFRLFEAVGHLYVYGWLVSALLHRQQSGVRLLFPSGDRRVDFYLIGPYNRALIKVRSFTSRPALDEEKVQAARHAKELGATEAALCLFVPMSDETAVFKLSSIEVMEDMMVSTVAIGWG